MRLLIDYCYRLNVWAKGYNSVPLYSSLYYNNSFYPLL